VCTRSMESILFVPISEMEKIQKRINSMVGSLQMTQETTVIIKKFRSQFFEGIVLGILSKKMLKMALLAVTTFTAFNHFCLNTSYKNLKPSRSEEMLGCNELNGKPMTTQDDVVKKDKVVKIIKSNLPKYIGLIAGTFVGVLMF